MTTNESSANSVNNNNNNNNMNDQSAYLTVGTEVSAKFKGAFCEAKIKYVQKLVKCKVVFKQNNEQCVITDDNIRGGLLKIGHNVDARRTLNDPYEPAQINKIQDLSTYTVVFNDGDERTLKRSFLRFKGERHYQDSETLNNSPLTHPEHFSNPVKTHLSANSGDHMLFNNNSITKQSSPLSTTASSPLATADTTDSSDFLKIGSVVCVARTSSPGVVGKKSSADDGNSINSAPWYPAIVLKIRYRNKTVFVRSFKDFKMYMVKSADVSEYSKDKAIVSVDWPNHDDTRAAIDIANNYLQNGQLPTTFHLNIDQVSPTTITTTTTVHHHDQSRTTKNKYETQTSEYASAKSVSAAVHQEVTDDIVSTNDELENVSVTTSNEDIDYDRHHQDEDASSNDDDNEDADDDDDDDDDDNDDMTGGKSDGYRKYEIKDRFVAQLYKFMDDRDTPINKLPIIENCDLDLYKLYTSVKKLGGYNKVTKQKLWTSVYKKLQLPNLISANVVHLKSAYKRYLHPYEEFDRKLGSSICDVTHNSIRSSVDSHRSLHLFKNRIAVDSGGGGGGGGVTSRVRQTTIANQRPSVVATTNQQQATKKDPKKCQNAKTVAATATAAAATPVNTQASVSARTSSTDDSNTKTLHRSRSVTGATKRHLSLNEMQANGQLSENKSSTTLLLDYIENVDCDVDTNDDVDANDDNDALTLTSIVKNINDTYRKQRKQQQQQKKSSQELTDDQMASNNKNNNNKDVSSQAKVNKNKKRSKTSTEKSENDEMSANQDFDNKSENQRALHKKRKLFTTWSQQRKFHLKKKNTTSQDEDDSPTATTATSATYQSIQTGKIKTIRPSSSSSTASTTSTSKTNKSLSNTANHNKTLSQIKHQKQSNDESSDNDLLKTRLKRQSQQQKEYKDLTTKRAMSKFNEKSATDTDNETATTNETLIDRTMTNERLSHHTADWHDSKHYTFDDIEVNRMIDVKYGNFKLKKVYEAKIVKIDTNLKKIFVHYLGWNNRYDEWIELNRICKVYKDENCGNGKRKRSHAQTNKQSNSGKKQIKVEANTTADSQKKLVDDEDDEMDDDGDHDAYNMADADDEARIIDEKRPIEQDDDETTTLNTIIVSIKNEYIDAEYEKNLKSENKLLNSTDSDVDDVNSSVVPISENTENEVKSANAMANNKRKKRQMLSTSESTDSKPTTDDQTTHASKAHKYEIFRPSVKMQRKEPVSTVNSTSDSATDCAKPVQTDDLIKSEYDFIEDISEYENDSEFKTTDRSDNDEQHSIVDKMASDVNNGDAYVDCCDPNARHIQQQQHQPLSSSSSLNLIAATNSNSSFATITSNNIESEQEENIQPAKEAAKFVFQPIEKHILGEERIRLLEEQIRECRKTYLKLKTEVSIIDRKRKKHRKKQLIKQQTNPSATKIDVNRSELTN